MRTIKTKIMIKEPIEKEKTSEGGIVLTAEKVDYTKPLEAEVVSVGSEVKEVKVGDTIYYMPRVGNAIKQDDFNYRVLDEDEVVAIK